MRQMSVDFYDPLIQSGTWDLEIAYVVGHVGICCNQCDSNCFKLSEGGDFSTKCLNPRERLSGVSPKWRPVRVTTEDEFVCKSSLDEVRGRFDKLQGVLKDALDVLAGPSDSDSAESSRMSCVRRIQAVLGLAASDPEIPSGYDEVPITPDMSVFRDWICQFENGELLKVASDVASLHSAVVRVFAPTSAVAGDAGK